MWEEGNYPKDKDEFAQMLEALGVEDIESWIQGEFDKTKVNVFLMLRDIWDQAPNPAKAEALLKNKIRLGKEHTQNNPGHDPATMKMQSVDICERWLEKGIEAKEIVTVMRDYYIEAVYSLLQSIEQPSDFEHGIERSYGLYEVKMEDYCPVEVDIQKPIHEQLSSYLQKAKPAGQPPMPYWC